MAAFSDTETSTNNVIQAGTLDLTLDGASQSVTVFEGATDIAPGDEDSDSVTLGNAGSIEGTIELSLDDVRNYENTLHQAEEDHGDDSPNEGELQEFLEVRATIDGNEIVSWTTVASLPKSASYSTNVTLGPGDTTDFVVEWRFIQPEPPDHKEVNVAQSDSVELDMSFALVQIGSA